MAPRSPQSNSPGKNHRSYRPAEPRQSGACEAGWRRRQRDEGRYRAGLPDLLQADRQDDNRDPVRRRQVIPGQRYPEGEADRSEVLYGKESNEAPEIRRGEISGSP